MYLVWTWCPEDTEKPWTRSLMTSKLMNSNLRSETWRFLMDWKVLRPYLRCGASPSGFASTVRLTIRQLWLKCLIRTPSLFSSPAPSTQYPCSSSAALFCRRSHSWMRTKLWGSRHRGYWSFTSQSCWNSGPLMQSQCSYLLSWSRKSWDLDQYGRTMTRQSNHAWATGGQT